jgi:Bacterial Ig-like domain
VNRFSYTAPNTATDTLTLYDIAGNTTTKVLTLTGIPAAPVASMTAASDSGSSNSDGYTSLSPVYTWPAVTNATGYVLVVDGGPQIDLGNVLTTTLSGYADGPHTVAIYSKNAAGLSATAYTGSFNLDTLAQAVPTPASLSDTTNLKPTFTWTSISGATSYLVSLDGGAETSVANANFTPSFDLSIGSHNIKVRSVDQAGNQSVQSSAATVNVIPTAPLSPTNLTINGGAT